MKNFKLFALVLCLVMLVSSAAMADMTRAPTPALLPVCSMA